MSPGCSQIKGESHNVIPVEPTKKDNIAEAIQVLKFRGLTHGRSHDQNDTVKGSFI